MNDSTKAAARIDQQNGGALNLTGDVIAYENGEMDEAEVIEFFQRLVDTGLAWQLQGSYGRTANDLLRAGLITTRHSAQWR